MDIETIYTDTSSAGGPAQAGRAAAEEYVERKEAAWQEEERKAVEWEKAGWWVGVGLAVFAAWQFFQRV